MVHYTTTKERPLAFKDISVRESSRHSGEGLV